MKKFKLVTLVLLFVGITFNGCTMTPEERIAYNLKKKQKAQCKRNFKNCMINNSNGRDMTNPYTAQGVLNYCKQSTCY